jgi:replicative DNA helicase
MVKKCTLLRKYEENGFNTKELFNYDEVDLQSMEDEQTKLVDLKEEDIVHFFRAKLIDIQNGSGNSVSSLSFRAGDGIEDLLQRIHAHPIYGYPFRNGFYNSLCRGMLKKRLLLRSGDTGTGKTRQDLADMLIVACDEIWDDDTNKWVSVKPSFPSLFISTELDKDDVQILMLAFVSGVPADVIEDGNYSDFIAARLKKAAQIIKACPMYCEYIEDFSISDIEDMVTDYIVSKNVEYIGFDYIQSTPKLMREIRKAYKADVREDEALRQLSAGLKQIAVRLDVFVESSTQLNRNGKDVEKRDSASLRGGSGTADKVDHGVLCFRATKKDLKELQHAISREGFNNNPNFSHWWYKNRKGMDHVIVWSQMDLAKLREKPLFVTDYDYNLLNVDPISLRHIESPSQRIEKQQEEDKRVADIKDKEKIGQLHNVAVDVNSGAIKF